MKTWQIIVGVIVAGVILFFLGKWYANTHPTTARNTIVVPPNAEMAPNGQPVGTGGITG